MYLEYILEYSGRYEPNFHSFQMAAQRANTVIHVFSMRNQIYSSIALLLMCQYIWLGYSEILIYFSIGTLELACLVSINTSIRKSAGIYNEIMPSSSISIGSTDIFNSVCLLRPSQYLKNFPHILCTSLLHLFLRILSCFGFYCK